MSRSFLSTDNQDLGARRIDLTVKDGEFISIIGPSGAGKSRHFCTSWECTTVTGPGRYFFMNVPVHALKHKERADLHKRNIGFVFQSYHSLDSLTGY